MHIAVNNTAPRSEIEFKERVLLKMKKQIRKKIIGPEGRTKLSPVASHSCTKSNSIEQIKNRTV